MNEILGAVLVGGRSSRMGRDKALIEVDAVPMAQRVAAAMRTAGIERVVAVGPAHLTAGLEPLDDLHPGEGPLGAIVTALTAAPGAAVLVAACDLAWLDADTVGALLDAEALTDAADADVFVATTDRIEPMCALWRPSSTAPIVAAFASGERAVHRAITGLRAREVSVDGAALRNVNTPDDLPLSTVRDEGAHHGDIRDQCR